MLAAGDKAEKVRRRATAALGELLFYVATQGPAPEPFAPVGLPIYDKWARATVSDCKAC